jgi:hypothetical protein
MLDIVMRKDDIIQVLKKHRDRFDKSFEALMEAWAKKNREYTERALREELEENEGMPYKPKDRRPTYDFYIKFFSDHIENKIELDESHYKRLILDEWGWTRMHVRMLEEWASDSDAVQAAFTMYDSSSILEVD